MTNRHFRVELSGEALQKLFETNSNEALSDGLAGLCVVLEDRHLNFSGVTRTSSGFNYIKLDDEGYFPRQLTGGRLTLSAEVVQRLSEASYALKMFFDNILGAKRTADAQIEHAKKQLVSQVLSSAVAGDFQQADKIYSEQCGEWWSRELYERALNAGTQAREIISLLNSDSLASVDQFFRKHTPSLLTADTVAQLKAPRLRACLNAFGVSADNEQLRAIASPYTRVQVKARAGSGKTRTLSTRAAVAIADELLEPNQVLILAFNKAAAVEIGTRVGALLKDPNYDNARTFHSLAHQLAKPSKKILFDQGQDVSMREQSLFGQRMLRRIINPAFQEEMVRFFREELEQIEDIGRDLQPEEYFIFRRSLEHVTLGGQWVRSNGDKVVTNGERVKSKGEKFIADFLFEHDIPHRYERAWIWKAPFLDGTTYRPDFSMLVNGYDVILEHWAFDPNDPVATLPTSWRQTAKEYSQQIEAKRKFWASQKITLLETHAGMVAEGREAFEFQLKAMLEHNGIQCIRLPESEIVKRVFQNDFMISRMAVLFIQFISRAKKHGWSPESVAKLLKQSKMTEPRTKSFHQLALRAFREYELMKEEECAMDFDDLLQEAAAAIRRQGARATLHLGQGRSIALGKLRWILLDEYQDFSHLYFGMINAILDACPDIRVVAVGDDWQAINSFAGADLSFYKEFDRYFPDGESVAITTNYRSTARIVQAGNAVMCGRGEVATSSHLASLGSIEVFNLSSMFVQFMRTPATEKEWQKDQIYLPTGTNGHASETVLRQAQAFKFCVEILKPSFDSSTIAETAKVAGRLPYVLLLSRTGHAYGFELQKFKERLVGILIELTGADEMLLNRLIQVITAHGAKGREAHTVIILDATERQFPKIHPDSLLFEVFGTRQKDVLAEEQRLFYVAISRAISRLAILTEKDKESPYLKLLPLCNKPSLVNVQAREATKDSPTEAVAKDIAQQIYSLLEIGDVVAPELSVIKSNGNFEDESELPF